MQNFSSFSLHQDILRALDALSFVNPTPIQTQAIPNVLEGRDLIATAQTGTGKTGAFCIPIACHLKKHPGSVALVLAPTRELVQQIDEFWKQLTRFSPELPGACIIGGASFGMQNRALSRKPRMIIATPGRLCDHIHQRTVNLSKVTHLVLDEADRMLDMGFAPQLNEILGQLPAKRQNLFFSATWEAELDRLSKKYLKNPFRVAVGSTSQAAKTVAQSAVQTTPQQKNHTLLDEINTASGSILVFARTKARTDRLARFLDSYGLDVGRIHGDRTQAQRNAALQAFKDGKVRILVATDIAARGIDVTEIGQVINYDLPMVAEDYIHRIGRTGRAGTEGRAISLITSEDKHLWRDITQLLKKTGSSQPALRQANMASKHEPPATKSQHLKSETHGTGIIIAPQKGRASGVTGVIRPRSPETEMAEAPGRFQPRFKHKRPRHGRRAAQPSHNSIQR